MPAPVLKNIYLITEGEIDAQVICTILNIDESHKVYRYVANGFNNMPSICKTLRLMIDDNDKILLVFDSDSLNIETIENQISMMEFLTQSNVSKVKIGIFCLVPYLEQQFGIPEGRPRDSKYISEQLIPFLKENIESIRDLEIVKKMHEFLGGDRSLSYFDREACKH